MAPSEVFQSIGEMINSIDLERIEQKKMKYDRDLSVFLILSENMNGNDDEVPRRGRSQEYSFESRFDYIESQ